MTPRIAAFTSVGIARSGPAPAGPHEAGAGDAAIVAGGANAALRGAGLPLRLLLALRLLRRRRGGRRGARGRARRRAAPETDDRRGDEDARVGAGDDAD